MSLSIGLEALKSTRPRVMVSFESLYSDTMEASSILQNELQHGLELLYALENVYSVKRVVDKYGFTKSLESLIGHQLGKNTKQVSMEAEANKKGIWATVVDFIRRMIRYVRDFFAKAIGTRRGMMLKLNDIVTNDRTYSFKKDVTEIAAYSDSQLTSIVQDLSSASVSKAFGTVELPENPKLTVAGLNIKTYAKTLVDALKELDKLQTKIDRNLKDALKNAENNINKPKADIEEARKIRESSKGISKGINTYVNGVFKSARAFMKAVTKGKKEEKKD